MSSRPSSAAGYAPPSKRSETTTTALCPGRCDVAWHALAALRSWESGSEQLATRRKNEYETQRPHTATLSELLLGRWRAGDWTVKPEDLLGQLGDRRLRPT